MGEKARPDGKSSGHDSNLAGEGHDGPAPHGIVRPALLCDLCYATAGTGSASRRERNVRAMATAARPSTHEPMNRPA